ncbi:MAG: TolC family protein [Treponema sp.]|nr:TolC family protein [Treponema sp.]
MPRHIKVSILLAIIFARAGAAYGNEALPAPLSFAQAADLAVSFSPDLRGEYKAQKIRENAWVLGALSYLPRLNLSVQENDRLQEIGADSFLKNYSISMDQLLWDGGRLSMSRKLERMELNLAVSQLERMADEIADAALSAYRSVLSTRAILVIRQAALEYLAGQLQILEKEVELGLALPLDIAEAELAFTEARIEIVMLESDLVEMERQFSELLGLENLPALGEKIDINRAALLPSEQASVSLAGEKNPDLAAARFSIAKRQTELKYSSRTWIPALRLNGGFGLSGGQYPLNRHTWSVGLNVEFASPWLQNTFAMQAGWESPRDRTAGLQNSASPLPNPAASLGKRQAALALALEQEKYALAFERTGRNARRILERCMLADRRRRLAVEAIDTAARRYGLEEIRLGLGQITRLDLIEAHIVYTEKEIAAVESAIGLLQMERELERLLDLKPGELASFARSCTEQFELNGDML